MATQQELIKQIVSTIDAAVVDFGNAVPEQQQRIFDEVSLLVKKLDLSGDNIAQSAKNLRIIGEIKSKLDAIVNSPEWSNIVKAYLSNFETVTRLQNQYFGTLAQEFKPNALLAEIKKQSIAATLNSLTEAGIASSVTEKIQDILRLNITSGSNYSQLNGQLRDFIITNQSGAGALERYTKQITTDALNQYAAQYTNAVTNDLGLDWFMYVGAIIATSRPLCKGLIRKKYIHRSELPDIILGRFKEFEEEGGIINPKTKLPQGMIPGTNAANFHIYRGGYQCEHQLMPVDESSVPIAIRISLNRSSITDHAKGNLIGKSLSHPEFQGDVTMTKKGINEFINQNHDHYIEKNNLLKDIENLFGKSKYLGAFPDAKNNPMVEQYHYFQIDLKGKTYYVAVREYVDGRLVLWSAMDKIK